MLATITSKGQVTIPVDVRRAVGLETGTQVEFIVNARQRIELVPRHGDIRALRGTVPAPARPVPAEAIGDAARGAFPAEPAEAGDPNQAVHRVPLPPHRAG